MRARFVFVAALAAALTGCNSGLFSPSQIVDETFSLSAGSDRYSVPLNGNAPAVEVGALVLVRLGNDDPGLTKIPIAWSVVVDPPSAGRMEADHGEGILGAQSDLLLFAGTFSTTFLPAPSWRQGTVRIKGIVDLKATRGDRATQQGNTVKTYESELTLSFDPETSGRPISGEPRSNQPPELILGVSPNPAEGRPPLSVDFDLCGSSDPDGDALEFTVDFGDGSDDGSRDKKCEYLHPYRMPGRYSARACVSDLQPDHRVCRRVLVSVLGDTPAPKPPPQSPSAPQASPTPPPQTTISRTDSKVHRGDLR
jgi:hypothetical protein